MVRLMACLLGLLLLFAPVARAALKPGAEAPSFSTQASLAGKPFTFNLDEALKKGPVVLYFFPAAFTRGCTIEAHDFSEATAQFQALGATIIGVSGDNIETLKLFSVTECRNKFAVAADPDRTIMRAYESVLAINPNYATRTSYVITPDHKIAYSYSDMDPGEHVANTLAAVKAWRATTQ